MTPATTKPATQKRDPALDWIPADRERIHFLHALDAAPFDVTAWEAAFIESLLRYGTTRAELLRGLTARQRFKVDQLRKEYAHRLPLPEAAGGNANPTTATNIAPPIPQAEPGRCDYQIRDTSRPRCCGQPAVVKLTTGLELCEAHETERQLRIERLRRLRNRP